MDETGAEIPFTETVASASVVPVTSTEFVATRAPSRIVSTTVCDPSLNPNGKDQSKVVSVNVPNGEKSVPSIVIVAATMPAEISGSTYVAATWAEESRTNEPSAGVVDRIVGGFASTSRKPASTSTAGAPVGPTNRMPK